MTLKHFVVPCPNFSALFSEAYLCSPVVVVSIIGKTAQDDIPEFNLPNVMDDINELLRTLGAQKQALHDMCNFNSFFDPDENVLYLSLIGPSDNAKRNLAPIGSTLGDRPEHEQPNFLNCWSDLQIAYARALLFLSSVSHIVLFSSPSYTLNIKTIQLLKVLSYVRPRYQGVLGKILSRNREVSDDWAHIGRLCSPRLIFVFKGCPYDISVEKNKSTRISKIKRLEHDLEDQIYVALRNNRVVKEICSRALFSIAPNDEFVYVGLNIELQQKISLDDFLMKVNKKSGPGVTGGVLNFGANLGPGAIGSASIFGANPGPVGIFGTSNFEADLGPGATGGVSNFGADLGAIGGVSMFGADLGLSATGGPSKFKANLDTDPNEDIFSQADSEGTYSDEEIFEMRESTVMPGHSLQELLLRHIRKAHTGGFNDNIGKFSGVKSFFEVPTLRMWLIAANALLKHHDSGLKDKNSISHSLGKLLGTELKFSSSRCQKVFPLAIAVYQENLPSHYNEFVHDKQVKRAIAVFSHHARGPAQHKFVEQLKSECERIWRNGRQTCEALSLNKNPCTKPRHLSTSSSGLYQRGESDHWSGVQFYSSCNCGTKQGPRQDPFTLRAANYDFYQIIGQECGCIHLDSKKFRVFQPSSSDYREADLSKPTHHTNSNVQDVQQDLQNLHLGSPSLSTGKAWNVHESAHGSEAMSIPLSSVYFDQANNMAIKYYQHSQNEKHLHRQASTTEYLPGMIHLDSPPGLLPLFPSWSLLCRGPSSIYSHNLGLHDCPGFIPGSNYLLPWDVSFREKDMCKSDTAEVAKKPILNQNNVQILKPTYRRNQRVSREFMSVKIFIGMEYECLRGHRFMSSAPGVILKATGTILKEDAHRITEGNMPLFFPCPCGKVIAQLIRVHIVTPKAPVFVTVDPKIRPAPPPCPTFATGDPKPMVLSQSSYWVLRLPYVYASENRVFGIPSRLKTFRYGELLGPIFGITQDI